MSWVLAGGLAALAFAAAVLAMKAPRAGWEAIGAALLLGIAGYGLQGSPGVPGAPREPAQTIAGDPAAAVEARKALGGTAAQGSNWLMTADAFARRGQYADAAGILKGVVEEEPKNAEAWLALANALVGHAEGVLSPASLHAFRHAAEAAPDSPGPPFFLGLALAQSGRLAEARALWADTLQRSPADAPWRADLEQRLARLDGIIAQQGMGQGMPPAGGQAPGPGMVQDGAPAAR
jgi:cytochrome c-type biogenesis protein CcmH